MVCHKIGESFSSMNALAANTILQNGTPNSRKFSGKISAVTVIDNVDIARACAKTIVDRLRIGITVNDST